MSAGGVVLRVVLAPAAVAGVAAWAVARGRSGAAERALTEAREGEARAAREADLERRDRALQVTSLRADLVHTQEDLRRTQAALARQRDLAARLDQSRRAEREWSHELRAQLHRLYDRHGVLAHRHDVGTLVMRAAMELTEAEKGLLLSRGDEDHDGDLDLQVSEGFEHEPEHSAVVQRFARQVLADDEIVREDAPVADRDRTPADDEIETLVAIPVYLRDHFHGVVVCANREGGFEELDDELLLSLGDHAGSTLQSGRLREELGEAHRAALRMLAELLAAGDPLRHAETAELVGPAEALAAELGLDDRERDTLLAAVLVRDLGLLALPDRTVDHPGGLSADQRAAVELHPRIAFNALHQLPVLADVATAVLYHHERFDGRGYPSGLAGEAIPRLGRALAVLDTYNALVHDRPHRPARAPADALVELVGVAGTQLDPEITQLLVERLRVAPAAADDGVTLEAMESPALFGALASPTTDALTLLGNHRAFAEHVARVAADARPEEPFAVAVVQLEDLGRVNEQAGYAAGDRLIQVAARHVQRVAGRLGVPAFRESGRRLGLVVPGPAEPVAAQVEAEFAAGPPVRVGLAEGHGGERPDAVADRARAALRPAVGATADG